MTCTRFGPGPRQYTPRPQKFARYNTILNSNPTSVAVLTHAFAPVLRPATSPEVINASSGLGSMRNALTCNMGSVPAYGASKVGMNGLSMHLQVEESDCVASGVRAEEPKIKRFVVAPGLLRTFFTGYSDKGREPNEAAK
ncbi:hypothetical protein VMCG_04918 [Cytospora schulzeri]|uniref:Uncharacterized protein n=1 Tax=Cytospora schulzeri TaxID=448051 RepID=A0A423WN63_9PEZI|nr:hypothetical protein VMCG_04918 [Valsa malicola]